MTQSSPDDDDLHLTVGRRAKRLWRASIHSWPTVVGGRRTVDSEHAFILRARLTYDRARVVEIPLSENQVRKLIHDGTAWLEAPPEEGKHRRLDK